MARWIKAVGLALLAGLVILLYDQGHVPAEPLALAQYLGDALAETGAPNRVAAIYLNYRMFDSLFETMLLLVCVLAVVRMSWRGHDPDEP